MGGRAVDRPHADLRVFASFPEQVGQNADGTAFYQDCHVRLYGRGVPEEGTSETVVLTRED